MDNRRVFLWLLFAGFAWLTYTAWLIDYAPPPPVTPPASTQAVPVAPPPVPTPTGAVPTQPLAPTPDGAAAQPSGELIRVRTDVLDVVIDSRGADLVQADVLGYPVEKHRPETNVRLLDRSTATRWVFQSGFSSTLGGAQPDHAALYRTANNEYTLAPGQNELVVTFDWVGEGPLSARKTYTFHRGQYAIDLKLTAAPTAGSSWRGAPYVQMERLHRPVERSFFLAPDALSFLGPVLYNGESFDKLDVPDLVRAPIMEQLQGGWFAAIQHHFLAAAVPPPGSFGYTAKATGSTFYLSAIGAEADATAAAPLDTTFKLFVGPKVQEQLEAVGNELERTVDYGITTPLAQPLFWLLATVEEWVKNWGFAIIIVTILIKLAFYKLTAMSGRSQAKLRKVMPRMKALQERYKDDRQALSQAMMELYKREKVNPASGCLPVLIQMPFFFAFYWVLVESVEMRQAPFALWLDDLSAPDPFFVLPILMAAAMWFQMRLSPAPPDPMQARMMQIMPIVFSALLLFLPAGLVLYQLTNTVLSIAQQWRINTLVARESAAT